MITLKTPIAQVQNKISPSPLWEELSDESAASCGGGNNLWLLFGVGGKYIQWHRAPASWASWSDQDVYNYLSLIGRQDVQLANVRFLGIIRS
jgi:hypothetical protein